MREFLLAAESGAAAGLSGWDLALQYIIYGAVIVLSIVILILIRKRTRLPRHAEIKARLDKLLEQAQSLSGPAENRMDFIKRVSRTLYLTDDLEIVFVELLHEREKIRVFRIDKPNLHALHSFRNSVISTASSVGAV